jgi:hypothetical protein
MAAKGRNRPDPDGTWVAQKYGHAGETNWCGHHVRRPASGQFSASQVDTNFENLRVPRTWKGVLFVDRAFVHGAVQEMKVWPFAAARAEGGGKPPHAALAEDLVNMSGGGAWYAWPPVLYE